MKQGQFEALYQATWQEFDELLDQLEEKRNSVSVEGVENFSQLYRKVCHFHALAKERNYSSFLVDRLGEMIVRGHQHLYRRKYHFYRSMLSFITIQFPALVRKEWKLFWVATGLFYIPLIVFCLAIVMVPELVYTVMGPDQVQNFEEMYNPANRTLGEARDAETNWAMFGFYINNNIGVSFRTFASGLLWGLGSIFFLVFNGLHIGAATGHIINVGYNETFFTFVVGHGSFELTAIVISGAAGLKMGLSLLFPGNLTRLESLKKSAHVAIQLVYGVIIMLVIAAFLEAFWSSGNYFAPWQKYLVGGFLWVVVIAYLTLSGRGHEPR